MSNNTFFNNSLNLSNNTLIYESHKKEPFPIIPIIIALSIAICFLCVFDYLVYKHFYNCLENFYKKLNKFYKNCSQACYDACFLTDEEWNERFNRGNNIIYVEEIYQEDQTNNGETIIYEPNKPLKIIPINSIKSSSNSS